MKAPTGYLVVEGWEGSNRQQIAVIGATPKKFRIKAITRTKLAGRNRWLEPGQEALVPQTAVRDNCQKCQGVKGGVPGNENIVEGQVLCDYCSSEALKTS